MLMLRAGYLPRYDLAKTRNISKELRDKKYEVLKNCEFSTTQAPSSIYPGVYKKSRYSILYKSNSIGFLWNTVSDACVLLNEEELRVYESIDTTKIWSQLIESFYELGFLVDEETDELFYVNMMRHEFSYSYPETKHIDVEILPTQQCNARCFYCFKKELQGIKMTPEVEKKVVEYLSRSIGVENDVRFIWFGGEPLLATSTIDRIINGVINEVGEELKYASSISTNGSLIDDEIMNKFCGRWRVDDVLLPLDGYKEHHNERKSYVKKYNAYDKALLDMRRLLDNNIHLTCRINMDKFNRDQLPFILDDVSVFNKNEAFHVQITTLRDKVSEFGVDKTRYICPEEYEEFYRDVIGLLIDYDLFGDPMEELPIRYRANCIACSLNKIIINSNGKLFRCVQDSMEDGFSVGDCERGIIINKNYTFWYEDVDNLGLECNECILLPCCHGGCKLYRLKPTEDTIKCLRTKYYLDMLFSEIIKKYKEAMV